MTGCHANVPPGVWPEQRTFLIAEDLETGHIPTTLRSADEAAIQDNVLADSQALYDILKWLPGTRTERTSYVLLHVEKVRLRDG